MTFEEILPEARKGRRFRKLSLVTTGSPMWQTLQYQGVIGFQHLFADDWQLEPLKKELSREDLAKAWDKYVGYNQGRLVFLSCDCHHFSDFCRELGL